MSILAASVKTKNLPQQVLRWKSMVESECSAQGVPELIPYVLGIIMVESDGNSEKTPDIMQSSESQGWPMNTIKNPKDSIYYGVKHLKGAFDDAKKNGITDLSAIVQSYNFGRAYLRWLASNKKQHSLPVADLYSKTVVAPSLGNTTGSMVRYSNPIAVAYNGGYRYKNGGNFFYAEIVKQYVDFDGGTNPSENKEPSEWARSAWKWGLEKGIVDGNSHPHGTVVEEILVHMLQRVYNNKVFLGTGSAVSFAIDTSYRNGEPSEWARDAWKWGLEKGIVDGNSHPHGEVTEEILVHMLQRVYNNKVFSGTGSSGAFVTNVSYQNGEPSEWARDAWKWGLEKGIIDGNSHPHGKVTEEILVHILQRCTNNGVFK
ncbi:lysozyme family protein [Bacillus wiedmannii]|uniref:lysozyme family protein n=1 Tax=Bacillus wiedmannii TaxID=1890302 RepID=UPI001D0DC7A7|nr:lysozyme family protein [Bacillus wiedmannii]MCC2328562.1 lysozyme family protein [Bacillus wiedmannii]